MVKCALCGTPGVNKSTCPLYVKNPTQELWEKHFKAIKPEKSTTPKRIFLKQPTIKTPLSVGRTPPRRFTNPYISKSRSVNLVKHKIMESAKVNKHIILHGNDLVHFHIHIKDPKSLKIKLNKSTKIIKKLNEILQLMIDIYIAMSQKLVTRSDYFTNPDLETKKLLTMLTESKNQLIKFIIDNREGGGGGQTVPSFTVPLDEMINDLDFLKVSEMLEALPTIPSSVPKIKSTTKKVSMSHAGYRKKHTRKNKKYKRR